MSARKRKRTVDIPDSFSSHLESESGIKFVNFHKLFQEKHGNEFLRQTIESPDFINQLIEEALRFLYLVADNLGKDTIIYPSCFVKIAVDCLALNNDEYRDICDALLTLSGRDSLTTPERVLSYNALNHMNAKSKLNQLKKTLTIYKRIFSPRIPPEIIWNEYTSADDAFVNHIINVSINDADECHYYTMKRNESFTKIVKEYAIDTESDVTKLTFSYNTKPLDVSNPLVTPLALETYKNGCENEVILDVVQE